MWFCMCSESVKSRPNALNFQSQNKVSPQETSACTSLPPVWQSSREGAGSGAVCWGAGKAGAARGALGSGAGVPRRAPEGIGDQQGWAAVELGGVRQLLGQLDVGKSNPRWHGQAAGKVHPAVLGSFFTLGKNAGAGTQVNPRTSVGFPCPLCCLIPAEALLLPVVKREMWNMISFSAFGFSPFHSALACLLL